MKKYFWICALVFFLFLYLSAVFTGNGRLGDQTQPFLTITTAAIIYRGFIIRESRKSYWLSGILLMAGVLIWTVCDIWWAVQSIILGWDPADNFLTANGYFLTNLLLLLSILVMAFQDWKSIHKVQAMLDLMVVSACMSVLLWLFVFGKSLDKAAVLLSDPVAMASLLTDILLFAWICVWNLSRRMINPVRSERIYVLGAFFYVITDLIYFYLYFYIEYIPNSWIDAVYMISFAIIAVAALLRRQERFQVSNKLDQKVLFTRIRIEALILLVPPIVLIFKRDQIPYVVFLVILILVYYVLINFTQKSIFQSRLLEAEKDHVLLLEKKVAERTREISKILNTDYLTGLINRRVFEQRLMQETNWLRTDEFISILYVDQNRSKAIKHLYGKEIAEKLQRSVSDSLEKIVREYHGLMGSYGDDVFVIMLTGYEAVEEAKRLAENLILRCDELFEVDKHTVRVTVNIGIACFPHDTMEVTDLIKNAEIAMMQARSEGFNHIRMYSDRIGNLIYNRHRIEMMLKKTDYEKEMQLHYQPQVNCRDGSLVGFEALVRWCEVGGSWIAPLDFIPIAEETGIIVPLGIWIAQKAAGQAKLWQDKFGAPIRMAVNVSARQLVEPDFVTKIADILDRYRLAPEQFEIEITESQQFESSINMIEILNQIKRMGISIAIDDFGTGYSSLYYLKNLPADRIKIAKELIDQVETETDASAIIQMVISVAKAKNIRVIAEGVEKKEQWEALQQLGCDEIQGYYFGKPMSVSDIEEKYQIK